MMKLSRDLFMITGDVKYMNYYEITPVSWNSAIGNGGSIEFGIIGSGSIGNTVPCTVEGK